MSEETIALARIEERLAHMEKSIVNILEGIMGLIVGIKSGDIKFR